MSTLMLRIFYHFLIFNNFECIELFFYDLVQFFTEDHYRKKTKGESFPFTAYSYKTRFGNPRDFPDLSKTFSIETETRFHMKHVTRDSFLEAALLAAGQTYGPWHVAFLSKRT